MENTNGSLENNVEESNQPRGSSFDRAVTSKIGCAGLLIASPLAFVSGGYMGQEILMRVSNIFEMLWKGGNIYAEPNLVDFGLGGLAGMALYSLIAENIIQRAGERIRGEKEIKPSYDNKRDIIKALCLDKLPVPYVRANCRKYLEEKAVEENPVE